MTHTHTTALHRTVLVAVSVLTLGTMGACAQSKSMMKMGGAARSVGVAVTEPDTAQTVLLEPLQAMVTKMKKLQPTGDADFDYGFQIKVYNEGIQNLLAKEVQSGKDSSVKQMAKSMLATAKADEGTINDILRQVSPARPNQVFMQEQKKNIDAISTQLQQVSKGDSLTSNIDKNFKILFADQSQAALDLSTTYLQYGRSNSLKAYAQQVVDRAKSDMAKMKGKMD